MPLGIGLPKSKGFSALRRDARVPMEVEVQISGHKVLPGTESTFTENVSARGARVLAMGLVCGGSFLILLEALTRGGAGFVLTLRNTSVLFATALGAAIGEPPRRAQVAGAVLVAGGAILIARP